MTRLSSAALLAAALCSSACGTRPDVEAGGPDLIVYGRVWTGDSTRPWAEAVAISGDTISAVGDSATIAQTQRSDTRVIANGKAMVAPGFMDGHAHFLRGGFQLTSVDLRDAASPAEFIARIKAFAAKLKPGEWILGGTWDHENWPGTPLPDRSWIDSVTPNNPVFVDRLDGHMALANSLALEKAGVTRNTREIPGGTIVRRRDGEPTGVLKDEAQGPVTAIIPIPSESQSDAALARAMEWAASKGVTAVADVDVPWYEVAALRRAHAAGKLTTRVSVYVPLRYWRAMSDTLRAHGAGDDRLRVAGVKGYVDGSLGSTTALFYQPYNDAPRTFGLFVTPEDSLRAWIGAADSAGLQVAVHAIGERANGVLLDIFDSISKAHGSRDRRFRVEHAQHLRRRDIARLATSGVVASMQPYHAIDDGRWAQKRIGRERIKTTYAFRSLLEGGGRLAFGSDWTVAPIDPILGIYAAVTRRTLDDKNPEGWVPGEKITVDQALRAYTTTNAYGVFGEKRRGKLAPGYLADLVVLDRNLVSIAPGTINQAQVRATVIGGEVVFQRE
jgi:predicted amidohydrolase YtcJ